MSSCPRRAHACKACIHPKRAILHRDNGVCHAQRQIVVGVHTALVHAAAGGVGLLLVQILKLRGARVIGVVSSAEKKDIALAAGADEVLLYSEGDLREAVRGLTGGEGADVVYDGVGKDTFEQSLGSLRRRGHFILFGAASGPVPPIEPRALLQAGSISFIRPGLRDFVDTREAPEARANDLFNWLRTGQISLQIGARFSLEQAAEAHSALEGRQTVGKTILTISS